MPIRSNIAQCIHFKLNGQRCGSPAVLGDRYCHWHQRLAATTKAHVNSALANVLLLEDADSVQAALIHVIDLLLRDQIPLQKARTILKAIELASRNVKNLQVALSTEQRNDSEHDLIDQMNLDEQMKWMEQRRVKRQEIEAELALPETEAEQAAKPETQKSVASDCETETLAEEPAHQTMVEIHAVADPNVETTPPSSQPLVTILTEHSQFSAVANQNPVGVR